MKVWTKFLYCELLFLLFTIIIETICILIFHFNSPESLIISLLYLILVHVGLALYIYIERGEKN